MALFRSVTGGACAFCLFVLLSGCGGGSNSSPSTSPSGPYQLSVQNSGDGAGTITSSPAGINCGSTCSGNFSANTNVTLAASPSSGSSFVHWNGACSGASACTVTMTGNLSVTAKFSKMPVLAITASGNGIGTISSQPAGIDCGKSCQEAFALGTQVTLTATPGTNSIFVGWSGACSGTGSCTVTMNSNVTIGAIFSSTDALTVKLAGSGSGVVTSNPSGINCGSTCSATFDAGTQVTLTAAPAAGSTFVGWSGSCTGTADSCTLTISTGQSVTATFQLSLASLTVNDIGNGVGTVTSLPAGINCPGSCSATFNVGTVVTLRPSAGDNSAFGGWSAPCSGTGSCQLTLNNNTSVNADFNLTAATLTVTLVGAGSGTVTSNPPGISCGDTCSATFDPGTQVTLTASANPNSYLLNWSGACNGTSDCQITMNANESVTATLNSPWPFNHIIFMAQENRSLDHYFGELRQYWADNGYPDQPFDGLSQFDQSGGTPPSIPGCDPSLPFQLPPAPFQDCAFDTNAPVTSYHLITQCLENPSPSWNEDHSDWNFNDPTDMNNDFVGNGYVHAAAHDSRNEYYYGNTLQYDTNGVRTMGYYQGGTEDTPGDLNFYYFMATQFATSDRWFSPVMSRTELNRDFMIGATSGGYAYPEGTDPQDSQQINSPVIFELLQNAGITWKIYVNPKGSPCETNPTPQCFYDYLSYVHTFVYGQTIINQFPQNIVPISQFFTDLQQGTLPQFAYIEPASSAGLDEHAADYDTNPPCCSIQAGANYVSSIMDGLMTSQYWKDSVFIFTYDEFGGFYDHVSPQPMPSPDGTDNLPVDLLPGDICTQTTGNTCNFDWTGYRIPLIVVSPFTKKNYVSHTVMDTTAFLKFTETRFGLPTLTLRDAAQPGMDEFFNFTNPPWVTPPSPPKQNQSGPCYLNQLP